MKEINWFGKLLYNIWDKFIDFIERVFGYRNGA